jgi:hypothetical protein
VRSSLSAACSQAAFASGVVLMRYEEDGIQAVYTAAAALVASHLVFTVAASFCTGATSNTFTTSEAR